MLDSNQEVEEKKGKRERRNRGGGEWKEEGRETREE